MIKIDRCKKCNKLTYLPKDNLCLLCLEVVNELENIEEIEES